MNDLAHDSTRIREHLRQLLPPFLSDRYEGVSQVFDDDSGSIYIVRQLLLDQSMELHIAYCGSNQGVKALLEQRAKVRSSLSHPSIPTVHDFGLCTNGSPFLIIDLPQGKRLDSIVEDRGALPAKEAVSIALDLASAMAHVHAQGHGHGRLSTTDLIVMSDGRACVTNLGFGTWSEDEVGSKSTFRAPVDGDVKAAGRILLEMVTGKPDAVPNDTGGTRFNFAVKGDQKQKIDIDRLHRVIKRMYSAECGMKEAQSSLASILASCQPNAATTSYASGGVFPFWPLLISLVVMGTAATLFFSDLKPSDKPEKQKQTAEKPLETVLKQRDKDSDNKLVPELVSKAVEGQLVLRDLCIDDKGLQYLETVNDSSVTRLDVSDTFITDASMKYIGHFPLVFLDLTRTEITDAGLREIGERCGELQNLRIGNTKVTAKGLHHLIQLKELETLVLHNDNLGDDAMTPLAQCKNLEKIDFEANKRITDSGLAKITTPKLKYLNIGDTAVTDDGLKALLKLPNLDNLHVGNSDLITNEGIKTLAKIPKLKRLTIRRSKVTDGGLLVLLAAPNLVELSVPGLKVSESIRAKFANELPNCRIISDTLREFR